MHLRHSLALVDRVLLIKACRCLLLFLWKDISAIMHQDWGPVGLMILCVGYLPQAWDEFKPYKKENKRTKARDATRASVSMDDADSQTADDG